MLEKRTKAGNTYTIQRYRRVGEHKGKRRKRINGTTLAQKEGNLRRATLQLMWLMNENFRDGDLLVTLDYTKRLRPDSSSRMHKDFRNFFDRIKRRCRKAGKPVPKLIRVVEIGSKGARHHHMVIQRLDLDILQECWGAGGIHVDPLYTDGNYRKIAEYFVKYARKTLETEKQKTGKLWYATRGLRKPREGKIKEIRRRELEQVKVPKGYYLDEDSVKAGVSRFDGYETFSYVVVKFPEKRDNRAGKGKGGSRHG